MSSKPTGRTTRNRTNKTTSPSQSTSLGSSTATATANATTSSTDPRGLGSEPLGNLSAITRQTRSSLASSHRKGTRTHSHADANSAKLTSPSSSASPRSQAQSCDQTPSDVKQSPSSSAPCIVDDSSPATVTLKPTARGKRRREDTESPRPAQQLPQPAKTTSSPTTGRGKGKAAEVPTISATTTGTRRSSRTSGASSKAPSLEHSEPRHSKKRPKRDSADAYNLRPRTSLDGSSPSNSKRGGRTSNFGQSMPPSQQSSAKAARSRARRSKNAGGGLGSACDHVDDTEMSEALTTEGIIEAEAVDSGQTNLRDNLRAGDEEAAEAEGEGVVEDDDEDNDEEDEEEDGVRAVDDEEEEDEDEDEDEEGDGLGGYDDEMDDAWADDGGAAFGSNLRIMAEYLSGTQSRFRSLLASLRTRKDPTAQLVALQELSEVLSLSNEETLAGYFPTESFTRELLYIMGGPKPSAPGARAEGAAKDDDDDLASAEAIDEAGLVDKGEMTLLACRCLANLIEAMPYAAHSVVSYGAVPLLLSKLTEIEFIDLAEQTLQTLEKISVDYPGAIVREGGLMAMLQYLDFFNIHIQRGAMTAASHCCRKLSAEHFPKALEVIPIIRNVLGYSDQRLVESACKCVVRMIESFKHQSDLLEQVLDTDLVKALNTLLLQGSPASPGAPTAGAAIGVSTYTEVLKSLGSAVRTSPKIAVVLLEVNVVETLYHLLTGSPAPNEDGQGGRGPAAIASTSNTVPAVKLESSHSSTSEGAVVAVVSSDSEGAPVADLAVLQNLAHRPKEQIQEALSLVSDLLPPLPRDGVFDSRNYTEKAWYKRKKQRSNRVKSKASDPNLATTKESNIKTEADDSVTLDMAFSGVNDETDSGSAAVRTERPKSEKDLVKEASQNRRIEMLRNRQGIVKRFTQLVLPTLVEVYAASVALHVRTKALTGMLKIMSFVEPEPLCQALDKVPLASFVASILSSRDDPALVLSALCMVEILCDKLPDIYQSLLRREGVMWEVEDIASKEPAIAKYSGKVQQHPTLSLPADPTAGLKLEDAQVQAPATRETSDPSPGDDSTGAVPSEALAAILGSANGLAFRRANQATVSKASGSAMSVADAQDANIWRARILRDTFARQVAKADGGADHALKALENIKSLVNALGDAVEQGPEAAEKTLHDVAILFSKADEPISSFELLRSGLVDGLYSFATEDNENLPNATRRELLLKALMTPDVAGNARGSAMVRRLQEALSRLENVDIVMTLNSGTDDSSAPSMRRLGQSGVHRQIRLRLQAENPSVVPKSYDELIVGIHAIASFDGLAEYLRPKIAMEINLEGIPDSLGGSRLSSVLAALGGTSARLESAFAADKAQATRPAAAAVNPATTTETKKTSAASSPPKHSASTSAKRSRRRSSRLSGMSGSSKQGEEGEPAVGEEAMPSGSQEQDGQLAGKGKETSAVEEASGLTSDEATRRLLEDLLPDGLDDASFSDEEMGEGIHEDESEDGPEVAVTTMGPADRTVNVSVAADGGELNTHEGTQIPTSTAEKKSNSGVGTPSVAGDANVTKTTTGAGTTAATATATASSSSARPSYSAALQRKSSDWHLEFSMDGRKLPLDSTIYAAVHEHTIRSAATPTQSANPSATRSIWTDVYTVTYKKVSGPVPSTEVQGTPEPEGIVTADSELPSSIPRTSSFAKVLQLLRVLHDLNSEWRETRGANSLDFSKTSALSETAFVNNKLTAKLNRQLEEAVIVASKCLPDWALQLPRRFSFLFPFEARYAFLQSTALGYNRMLQRLQNRAARSQNNASGNGNSISSRSEDSLAYLVRLPRAKVRISRENILPSAFRVMELYGKTETILEVEYFGEVGTGLGPTLEFYALTSKEFARKDLCLWRDQSPEDSTSKYVYAPRGLFPAPISEQDLTTSKGKGLLAAFKILGQFVAKSVLDSRIIDCHFSAIFMRAVLNQRVPLTLGTLKVIDATLATSLERLLEMSEEEVAALSLDFTLPGHPNFELEVGGKDKEVTKANLDSYVDAIVDVSLHRGIEPLIRAFRSGFNTMFPVSAMTSFTAEELVLLFGNTEEDWTESTLLSAIKPDHGYSSESATFHDLLSIMTSFTTSERREFLQWLTGSPKLPIGGFSGLQPQLTVVKRPHEPPLKPDDYLASNMSCANFLKLPQYSSREVMRQRLHKAVTEGAGAFNLS